MRPDGPPLSPPPGRVPDCARARVEATCAAALAAGTPARPAIGMAPPDFEGLGVPFPREGSVLLPLDTPDGPPGAAAFAAEGPDGAPSLRLAVLPRGAGTADTLAARAEAIADALGAHEVRTQGRVPQKGPVARAMRARGWAETGVSHVHEIEVAAAGRRLSRLDRAIERIGGAAREATLAEGARAAEAAAILDRAGILDGFEFDARMCRAGEGRILPGESPALVGPDGLRGFVLIAGGPRPDIREIVARWVAPRWAALGLVNLCLMQDCLARARAAGVLRARFRANPDRHGDTFALAGRLGGREMGRVAGYARHPDPETAGDRA